MDDFGLFLLFIIISALTRNILRGFWVIIVLPFYSKRGRWKVQSILRWENAQKTLPLSHGRDFLGEGLVSDFMAPAANPIFTPPLRVNLPNPSGITIAGGPNSDV